MERLNQNVQTSYTCRLVELEHVPKDCVSVEGCQNPPPSSTCCWLPGSCLAYKSDQTFLGRLPIMWSNMDVMMLKKRMIIMFRSSSIVHIILYFPIYCSKLCKVADMPIFCINRKIKLILVGNSPKDSLYTTCSEPYNINDTFSKESQIFPPGVDGVQKQHSKSEYWTYTYQVVRRTTLN